MSGSSEAAYVYDAVRTPFGRFGGALSGIRPDDLAALVLRALLDRSPDLDPAAVGEVLFGNANGAGEDNRNVARMAALLAGLPVSVPGSTVNRLCGSSLDAVMAGSRMIQVGDADVVLVGGVESMTRAPWVLPKPDRPFPAVDLTAVSTTLGWRLINPARARAGTGRQLVDRRLRSRVPLLVDLVQQPRPDLLSLRRRSEAGRDDVGQVVTLPRGRVGAGVDPSAEGTARQLVDASAGESARAT